jgi:hypothetical protein
MKKKTKDGKDFYDTFFSMNKQERKKSCKKYVGKIVSENQFPLKKDALKFAHYMAASEHPECKPYLKTKKSLRHRLRRLLKDIKV